MNKTKVAVNVRFAPESGHRTVHSADDLVIGKPS